MTTKSKIISQKAKPFPKSDLELGQHFLENPEILKQIVGLVPAGQKVLEIGAGPGQLTEALAINAQSVEAVEIDAKFKPSLQAVASKHANVNVIIDNILKTDFQKYRGFWVVGNIPYHITEPLMAKLMGAPIVGAVLLVGESFAKEVLALNSPDLSFFGKLTLVVTSFFKAEIVLEVGREEFVPAPRTDSAVLVFKPLAREDYISNLPVYLMRRLLLPLFIEPLVKNSLMHGLIAYKRVQFGITGGEGGYKEMTKNEARAMIKALGLSSLILEKNFEQLNNGQYKELYLGLLKLTLKK